jgi:hypothetical protein
MSVQAITGALAIQNVTYTEKLLLIVLANYADERGKCWPSQERLASDTCMTDRGVRKVFVSLEAKGLLRRQHRRRAGKQTSDMITLLFQPEPRSASNGAQPEPDVVSAGTRVTKQPEPRSAKPSLELKEPSTRATLRLIDSEASRAEREAIANGLRDLTKTLGGRAPRQWKK